MARVLVTGMSGVGKSAVAASLKERGYLALDTDHEASYIAPDGDWLWDEHEIARRLRQAGAETIFIVGSASNQVRFYDRVDLIVLLSAPTDVMLERIETRTNNPFGKSPEQRAKILSDREEFEPRLRLVAHHEIPTDRPLDEVVDAVLRVTGLLGA